MRRRILVASVLAAACTSEPRPVATAPAQSLTIVGVQDDARDQYALLQELEAAIGDGLGRDANATANVQRSWHGRRYTWETALVPIFCRSAARCFVSPFDHARFPDRRIHQGWMPQLHLDDAGFAALQETCAGKQSCVVRFTGTMDRFVFDPEHATAVEFTGVEIVGAREAAPTESWLASHVPIRHAS